MRTSRYSAPILLSLWLGGCIFSSELEGKLEAPPGNPADAGVGQGGSTTTTPDGSDRQSGTASGGGETNATGGSGGNGPTGSPSDSCEPTAGLMQLSSSTSSLSINTAGMGDNFSDLTSCGVGSSADGVDAFFALHLEAGETWHITAPAQGSQDPVLYWLSDCNATSCQGASDTCDTGDFERMVINADLTGNYILSVDGLSTGAAGSVQAVRVVCGDGERVAGEGCDPNSNFPPLDEDGDGCSSTCQSEINSLDDLNNQQSVYETEPNRVPSNANRLVGDGPWRVYGSLGGSGQACNPDLFEFNVPVESEVTVEVLKHNFNWCTGVPESRLSVENVGGDVSATVVTQECPDQTVTLAAGRYLIRHSASDPSIAFDYLLEVSLATVIPADQ